MALRISMKDETIARIRGILLDCVLRAFSRVSNNLSYRPFHEALLSEEVIKASSFERSFSTSFGQGPVEQISKLLANDNGSYAERQKETQVNVYKGAEDQIERILSDLRSSIRNPNWRRELQEVQAVDRGDTIVKRIISDLYIRKDDKQIFISIKTVKPNLDQTEIAKRDMLLLKAYNPEYQVYFGLYYNPGGPLASDYNWNVPKRIFDMINDPCVLIGKEYWDLVGGEGAYEELLAVFAEVGKESLQEFRTFFD